MRAHASVSTHAIALVLETVETGTFTRVSAHTLPPIVVEPRARDSYDSEVPQQRLSEQSAQHPPAPLLVETTTSAEDEATSPPVRESWRVQAANKAYGAIAPEKAAATAPRCSRRC